RARARPGRLALDGVDERRRRRRARLRWPRSEKGGRVQRPAAERRRAGDRPRPGDLDAPRRRRIRLEVRGAPARAPRAARARHRAEGPAARAAPERRGGRRGPARPSINVGVSAGARAGDVDAARLRRDAPGALVGRAAPPQRRRPRVVRAVAVGRRRRRDAAAEGRVRERAPVVLGEPLGRGVGRGPGAVLVVPARQVAGRGRRVRYRPVQVVGVARAEARGPPLRDPGREGGPVARRRHAWQLDGVEQQLSMGAACLLLRPGARVAPFRAQWLLGSVLPTRSSSARACMQPPP
ncbi:unnamed protein product, partial [Pelagomonas calceolata]